MRLAKTGKNGFTLVELLIYTALTIVVVGLFGGILITIVRIQGTQTGTRQVTQEADFILNTIKRHIRSADSASASSSTLTLTTSSSSTNPTVISLSGGAVLLQEGSQESAALSTDKVVVEELVFSEKFSGSDKTIDIRLKISNNTDNPQNAAAQTIETSSAPLKRF